MHKDEEPYGDETLRRSQRRCDRSRATWVRVPRHVMLHCQALSEQLDGEEGKERKLPPTRYHNSDVRQSGVRPVRPGRRCPDRETPCRRPPRAARAHILGSQRSPRMSGTRSGRTIRAHLARRTPRSPTSSPERLPAVSTIRRLRPSPEKLQHVFPTPTRSPPRESIGTSGTEANPAPH